MSNNNTRYEAWKFPFPYPSDIKYYNNPSVPVQDNKWWANLANKKDADKLWPYNKRIKIAFLNGTPNQKAKVKKYAQSWIRGIGGVQFEWVTGIHGDVRIAFTDKPNNDPIQDLSWSQVGTDSLRPSCLPESTHLNGITDSDPADNIQYERIIVEHEFGHILGLQFAPNSDVPAECGGKKLEDWRNTAEFLTSDDGLTIASTKLDWKGYTARKQAEIAKELKNSYGAYGKDLVDWTKYVNPNSAAIQNAIASLKKVENPPSFKVDVAKAWAEKLDDAILEPGLTPDSVMVFDWRNRISPNDLQVVEELYPFPIRTMTFGIQDAFDRSLQGRKDDDLVLYVISKDNYIHKNTRVIYKEKPTSKAQASWTGWERIVPVPPYARSFVALDFPDRLEFFVAANTSEDPNADESLFLYHNALLKDSGKWTTWDTVKHVSADLKLLHTKNGRKQSWGLALEPATILRAVEVDGGANVFFITSDKVLATIFRKAGEKDVPKNYHPVSGGSDVIAIASARIGAPTITNPPRIVAVTQPKDKAFDISISAPNKSTQNWSLNSEGTAHDSNLSITRLATGMATDTQHIIGISTEGRLCQNLNKDGWFSWNDMFAQMGSDKMPRSKDRKSEAKIVSVSVGVIASNDQEDGYLRGFAVTEEGELWVSRVDDEGNWDPWAPITADKDKDGQPIAHVPANSIPGKIKRVTVKRTRCGDLVVFVISSRLYKRREQEFDVLSSITYNYQGLTKTSQKYGFQRVWWNPRELEEIESKK